MLLMKDSTRSRVAGDTFSGVLMTRETVMCDTPAARATSSLVMARAGAAVGASLRVMERLVRSCRQHNSSWPGGSADIRRRPAGRRVQSSVAVVEGRDVRDLEHARQGLQFVAVQLRQAVQVLLAQFGQPDLPVACRDHQGHG
jgi:hypothetical protein